MKKVLLAAAAVACFGTVAMAGPNAGGTLIVVSDGVVYCADNGSPCGTSGVQDCESGRATGDGYVDSRVLNVLAAFAPGASPRVSGVVFGIAYSAAEVFISDLGGCGDFELATDSWPASGQGTAVTWNAAQTGLITDVYWFAAYNYYGNPQSFDLTAHPSQGSSFADDSVPAELDDIAGLGSFGFDGGASNLPCPGEAPGACCDPATGDCTIVFEADCAGDFDGGPTCDPNPCEAPAIWACCASDQSCSMQTEAECANNGGDWIEFATCEDEPCIVPVVESTWGEIKNSYR